VPVPMFESEESTDDMAAVYTVRCEDGALAILPVYFPIRLTKTTVFILCMIIITPRVQYVKRKVDRRQ
jgi:hypothetical protein